MTSVISERDLKIFIEVTLFNSIEYKLLPIVWESVNLRIEKSKTPETNLLILEFKEEGAEKGKEVSVSFPVTKTRDESYRWAYKTTAALMQVLKEVTKKIPILTVIEGGKVGKSDR